MDELDFNDKPVFFKQSRIAPAVKIEQTRYQARRTTQSSRSKCFRDIEQILEQKQLEKELDYYNF